MGNIKQINIKNRIYYFYNDIINIKDFDPSLIKIDKKSYKNIVIYHIGYITKKDEYRINSVNPLYLIIGEIDYTLKKIMEYLNIAFIDSNSEVFKKYAKIWKEIKDQIKKINNGKLGEYEKEYMRIKFNSDDLPLHKILKLHMPTITARSVFEEDGKYYPQVFLDDCLYEV